MTLLQKILAAEEATKPNHEIALKNYKGYDIYKNADNDFQLFDVKYNSLDKKHHLGLDSAKFAADKKFNQRREQLASSYPALARVLANY
jgi:hypothetical protein